MFPFQSNEFWSQQEDQDVPTKDDLQIMDKNRPCFEESTNPANNSQDCFNYVTTNTIADPNNSICEEDDQEKIKIKRKEIERCRRQQMSTLHSSLRSLLPREFIKGKRSMSDHINEAENYIKHLQQNIQNLTIKRDGLQNRNESSSKHQDNDNVNDFVTIHDYMDGVEIVITSNASCEERVNNFRLSTAIEVIIQEGLEVLSCASTKTRESIQHYSLPGRQYDD